MKRTVYDPDDFDAEERKRGLPLLVTLCGTVPSRKSQRTESPTLMRTVGRLKSMFLSVTVFVVAAPAGATTAKRAAKTRRRRMHGVRLALVCGSIALAGCGGGEERSTATTPQGSALRYGVIGDSYSNGESLGIDQAWPALLAERMGLDLVINPAVSGWTTEQALAEELPQLEQARPEVATLLIGTNDLVQRVAPATFRTRYRSLLAAMVRIVGSSERVVAVTTPDFSRKPAGRSFGDPAEVSRAIRRVNAIISAESAAQDVVVADVFAVSRRPTDPSPDGLHPSRKELEAWTDAIEPVARRAWSGLDE